MGAYLEKDGGVTLVSADDYTWADELLERFSANFRAGLGPFSAADTLGQSDCWQKDGASICFKLGHEIQMFTKRFVYRLANGHTVEEITPEDIEQTDNPDTYFTALSVLMEPDVRK